MSHTVGNKENLPRGWRKKMEMMMPRMKGQNHKEGWIAWEKLPDGWKGMKALTKSQRAGAQERIILDLSRVTSKDSSKTKSC